MYEIAGSWVKSLHYIQTWILSWRSFSCCCCCSFLFFPFKNICIVILCVYVICVCNYYFFFFAKFWLCFEDTEVKNEKKTWSLTLNVHAYESRLSKWRPDAEGQLTSHFIPDHSRIKIRFFSVRVKSSFCYRQLHISLNEPVYRDKIATNRTLSHLIQIQIFQLRLDKEGNRSWVRCFSLTSFVWLLLFKHSRHAVNLKVNFKNTRLLHKAAFMSGK